MEPFVHKNTMRLTVEQYVHFARIFSKKTRPLRRILILVLGIAALFWSYTLLFGVLALALLLLSIFLPRLLPWSLAHSYHNDLLLRESLTYGLTTEGLSLEGPSIHLQFGWNLLVNWGIDEEWLWLSPCRGPKMFFKVGDLEKEGLLDRILELAETHGKKFGAGKA